MQASKIKILILIALFFTNMFFAVLTLQSSYTDKDIPEDKAVYGENDSEFWSEIQSYGTSRAESMHQSHEAALKWQAEQKKLKEEAEIDREAEILARAARKLKTLE